MPTRSGTNIYDERGASLTLGRLLKSGGAGSVFVLNERRDEVAKLYHSADAARAHERKLRAMLALKPELPAETIDGIRQVQIAWPTGLLLDRAKRCIGFTMPLLDVAVTSDLEHVLQERQARAEGLPIGLGAKMALAANLAALLAALHRKRHYVVDLKPLNVRFYRNSLLIAMLDCDGFSVQGKGERFPAGQVTFDYLAAEFHGTGVGPGEEEQQDCFALAVIVFQLLNSGLHPYAGRPRHPGLPSDLPGRIALHLYPYGLKGDPQILPSPVSGHETFPTALRALFDRAFASQTRSRPSAQAWATLLMDYARRSTGQLVECRVDAAHQHFGGKPCAGCRRTALLARGARKAPMRRAASAAVRMQPQHGGIVPQPSLQLRPQHRAPASRSAANPTPAAVSQVRAASLLARLLAALVGTLLLGWAMGWGMPAYRRYAALEAPGWWDSAGVGVQFAFLALAVIFYVVWAPMRILGRRP